MRETVFRDLKKRLNRDSPIPLYFQIERELEKLISQGKCDAGGRLPSEVSLAEYLDVSHITVRNALAGLVEKGLIRRLRKAGTFVSDQVRTIAPCIGFFYHAEADITMSKRAECMQRYLDPFGYDLKMITYEKDFYEKCDLVEEVRRRQLAGAVIVALGYEACRRQLQELERSKFPHVRMGNNCYAQALDAPLIKGNDVGRTRRALDYLWNLGHRRIGIVPNAKSGETDEAYLDFYRGKEFRKRWFMYLNFNGGPGEYGAFPGPQLARGYLETNPDITAVMAEESLFCLDLVRQGEAMGRSVPSDLSLIALSEAYGFPAVSGLTGAQLPNKDESEKACEVLLKVMRGEWNKETKLILVDYEFTERDSVAPVREPAAVA